MSRLSFALPSPERNTAKELHSICLLFGTPIKGLLSELEQGYEYSTRGLDTTTVGIRCTFEPTHTSVTEFLNSVATDELLNHQPLDPTQIFFNSIR